MRFILLLLILPLLTFGQAVESFRSTLITFTSYNKTRWFITSPDSGVTWRLYVDTSTSGQAGQWKRIDNTSDSLSNPVLVSGDSTAKAIPENDLALLVTSSASSTNVDSAAFQLRAYRQFVLPIRKTGGVRTSLSRPTKNPSGPNRAIQDTVAFSPSGIAGKALRIGRISPEGTFIRLRPQQVLGTGKTVTDTLFGDSVWVVF